jgi:hypothetical protein
MDDLSLFICVYSFRPRKGTCIDEEEMPCYNLQDPFLATDALQNQKR